MDDCRYYEDGRLVIYRRSGRYQARIRLPSNGYIWRSLKTIHLHEAERLARRLFYKMEDEGERGLPVVQRTFAAVITSYIKHREKECDQGRTSEAMLRQIKRVAVFWVKYAGSVAVASVDDRVLKRYVPWRRDYYTNQKTIPQNASINPADKTLQWEVMMGKAVVKWAHEEGWRGGAALPTYAFTPKVKRVRPAFEMAEFRLLRRSLSRRVREAGDRRIRASREQLRSYVLILANSGMRVGEANSLRLRDVIPFRDDHGRRNYRFLVKGKTGERDAILRATAAPYVDEVLRRRPDADPDDWLFALPNGDRILSLNDQFGEALKEAGISCNSHGDRYSLYSLRHFYAVMALRKGLGVFEVARNMGTSVQMIQSYYGKHATSASFATRLGD